MDVGTEACKPHITLIDGRVMTTSLVLAEHFGKEHKNVLRAIDRAIEETPEDFHRLNFEPMIRSVLAGKEAIRQERAYRMTRDGFALIAMSFTGRKAMAWKVAYINAFNTMEAALLRKTERPVAATKPAPVTHPAEEGLPPLTPRPFLELLYALDLDLKATFFTCYLLACGAHEQVLCASHRQICTQLAGCLGSTSLATTIRRLLAWRLIDYEPGHRGNTPSTFVLHLKPLLARITAVQSQAEEYLGLSDDEMQAHLLH
ncbi:Rha family transcriptional regulator [Trinickia symbiotica]|uniref:Rha family transcriptional regulator n=1 Tax=Trinickia symbiotica TaxID=863227 RepID=UPI000371A64D|nr:Rha family transcriptional regulator [Trinickia symbiotica]